MDGDFIYIRHYIVKRNIPSVNERMYRTKTEINIFKLVNVIPSKF